MECLDPVGIFLLVITWLFADIVFIYSTRVQIGYLLMTIVDLNYCLSVDNDCWCVTLCTRWLFMCNIAMIVYLLIMIVNVNSSVHNDCSLLYLLTMIVNVNHCASIKNHSSFVHLSQELAKFSIDLTSVNQTLSQKYEYLNKLILVQTVSSWLLHVFSMILLRHDLIMLLHAMKFFCSICNEYCFVLDFKFCLLL